MKSYRLPELLIVLNFFDAVMTLALLSTGMATEANPIMNALIKVSPVAFLVIKVGLVTLMIYVLTLLEAKRSLIVLTVVYSALALYHLRSVLFLLAGV